MKSPADRRIDLIVAERERIGDGHHRGRKPLNPHKTISPITYKMLQGTELDSTKTTILKTLRLGTRKSQLALWQAHYVREHLLDIATMAGR